MNLIYSVPGCIKCEIVKKFMHEQMIFFTEKNVQGEGKEDFKNFYAEKRRAIFRSPGGRIEFPVFTDGTQIRQGTGPVLAFLHSGTKLDDFFSVGILRGEWVDGIHPSKGNPDYAEEFLQVLRVLKQSSMKLRIDTDDKANEVVQKVLAEELADEVVLRSAD